MSKARVLPQNASRANLVRVLLTRSKRYAYAEERESAIVDVLTDLRHLCQVEGFDFANLDARAADHYAVERSGRE